MNHFRTGIAARLAATALLAVASQFASAHAFPTHQVPAAGGTVPTSTNSVAIDFDDGLEPAFSNITVVNASGAAVADGKASIDKANARHMAVALKPLTPGVYTVTWVAVALDGHRTTGHYTFTAK